MFLLDVIRLALRLDPTQWLHSQASMAYQIESHSLNFAKSLDPRAL